MLHLQVDAVSLVNAQTSTKRGHVVESGTVTPYPDWDPSMSSENPADVTRLLAEWAGGDEGALDRLMPLCIRSCVGLPIARWAANARAIRCRRRRWSMRRTCASCSSTAHSRTAHTFSRSRPESWSASSSTTRAGATASSAGAGEAPVILNMDVAADTPSVDALALDEALTRLASLDGQQARIVEMRFFGGLTVEETANVLKISPRTVKRDWSMARAWLRRELSGSSSR